MGQGRGETGILLVDAGGLERAEMSRPPLAFVVGGALLLAGFFLLFMLSGCAAALGEPGPDGARPLVWGLDVGKATAAGGNAGAWLARNIGDPTTLLAALGLGTGGLGAAGIGAIKLIRSWANAKATAASATTAKEVEAIAYDEGRERAHAARDRADAAYLEGLAHASGRGTAPVVPVANQAGGAA